MASFSELPTPMKYGAAAAGGTTVVGGGALWAAGYVEVWMIIGLMLVLFAIVLAIYAIFLVSKRRKRAESFRKDITQNTLRSGAVSDPKQRAEIEKLRRKFLDGVKSYKDQNFDLYEMPWLLVMGEPGSGKTLAIRKSNIGFLPGLQNEMQGAGGTVTMDWWFTRDAILLDTAGRYSMENLYGEERQTSELTEFLRLLRKHRRHCPVNGLILVISAESLLRDRAEEIENKAKRLANTLYRVQRELDVRFPVIVWVTKCDMIPGFRKYFEGLSNPDRQHQMLGWSNPDPLDTPFRPDQVEQHMTAFIEELKERRWSLLYELQVHGEARRIDAVDSLFAFPQNLSEIIPSLQRYLDLIFVDSRKPPFLRGIYFNSAVTEGEELDGQLAEAMGLSLEEMKQRKDREDSGIYKRDKAYFIRDSLLKKLFLEKNLVTRASNAVASLRRQQWLLGGITILAVGIMAVWGWFASRQLKENIGVQSEHWQYLANRINVSETEQGSDAVENIQLIGQEAGGDTFTYRGDQTLREFNKINPNATFLEYYRHLAEFSKPDEIRIHPLFRPFASDAIQDSDRREAWRIAFKTGILMPILRNTAEKLRALQEWDAEYGQGALISMLRWEGAVSQGNDETDRLNVDLLSAARGSSDLFIAPMVRFLVQNDELPPQHAEELDELLHVAFSREFTQEKLKAIKSLQFGQQLKNNQPIFNAISQFLRFAENNQRSIERDIHVFENFAADFSALSKAEDALLNWFGNQELGYDFQSPSKGTEQYTTLRELYGEYINSFERAKQRYENLPKAIDMPELQSTVITPLLIERVRRGESEIAQPFETLQAEVKRMESLQAPSENSSTPIALYGEVDAKLAETLADSLEKLTNDTSRLERELADFDRSYLAVRRGKPRMEVRFQLYSEGLSLFKTEEPNWSAGNPLQSVMASKEEILKKLESYASKEIVAPDGNTNLDDAMNEAVRMLIERALRYQTNYLARDLSRYIQNYMDQELAFPYIEIEQPLSFSEFLGVKERLEALEEKLKWFEGSDILDPVRDTLNLHLQTARALVEGNQVRWLEISVLKPSEAVDILDRVEESAGDEYRDIRLNKNDETVLDIFDPTDTWEVQLEDEQLVLECYEVESSTWRVLIETNASGHWTPLRLLLGSSMNPRSENEYFLKLKAPNNKYFVFKLSVKGGALPHSNEDWPRP